MRILVFLSVYLVIREIILNTLSTGKQREIILNSLSTGKQIDIYNSLSTGTGRCHYIIMQASCARTSSVLCLLSGMIQREGG